MENNHFKSRLQARTLQIGLWQGLANPYTAEICAGAGFDWLMFDGEHAPNTIQTMLAQLQAVRGYPVSPVGRPPVSDVTIIKQYLDIGFKTLLLPMINTKADAETAVEAVTYPPSGRRGVGSAIVRASGWSRDRTYLETADDEICVLVQIETEDALQNIEAIASVDGVDGLFIGPADLSASLGHRGQPNHPSVQDAIRSAISRTINASKACGILTGEREMARKYIAEGCCFVAVGTDVTLLARSTDELAAEFGRQVPAALDDMKEDRTY